MIRIELIKSVNRDQHRRRLNGEEVQDVGTTFSVGVMSRLKGAKKVILIILGVLVEESPASIRDRRMSTRVFGVEVAA